MPPWKVLAGLLLIIPSACGQTAEGQRGNEASGVSSEANFPDVFRCPQQIRSGLPLPNGSRVLGAPVGSAIALSSATVTADDVASIAGDLSGLAEVEPEDGPGSTDMTTQLQDARPAADTAFALVCRYGDPEPPLLARSVLLLPLPAFGGTYRCTTRLPQGPDRRPVSAVCRRS
jgi:hypothetical protein